MTAPGLALVWGVGVIFWSVAAFMIGIYFSVMVSETIGGDNE